MPPRLRNVLGALALLLAGAGVGAADVRAQPSQGDAATALQRAERAALENPRDAPARFSYGLALMDLRRDDEALAVFETLAQEYPELPDPLNNIALLHARAGRLEPARLALEAALRNDPGHRLARANLGQVHLMLAVQAWERAATAGPLEPAMQRLLDGARALLATGAAPPAPR